MDEEKKESKFGHLDIYIYFSIPKSTFVTGKGRGEMKKARKVFQ